jgi:hypothetical protein
VTQCSHWLGIERRYCRARDGIRHILTAVIRFEAGPLSE